MAEAPAVVFATERMDDDPGWRLLEPGELVHVDADLKVESRVAIEAAPSPRLGLDDLRPRAAASQSDSAR
jgi:glutamine amidotransferase